MRHSIKGYTVVELVIALVVVGIVAGIGIAALLETADAWSFASQVQTTAVQSSIVVMDRMSREIRRLKNDASIVTANANRLTFVDLYDNTIDYRRGGGNNLVRNSDILADSITALGFVYYDDSGNVITTPIISPNDTDIRRIDINFSILAGTNTLNFQFQVRPQNLKRLNEKFK